MGDVFDEAAAAPAPAGDVFDQVAAAKPPPSPADPRAAIAADAAGHRMDADQDTFLRAVASDPAGFAKSLPADVGNLVAQASAGALNIPAHVLRAFGLTPSTQGTVTQDANGKPVLSMQPKPLPFQPGKPLMGSDATVLNPEGSDANRLVSGLTTPDMLLTGPLGATRAGAGYFLSQTAPAALAAAGRAMDSSLAPEDRRAAVQEVLLNGGMAAGLAAHLATGQPAAGAPGEPPARPNVQTSTELPVGKMTPTEIPVLLPEPKADVFDHVSDGPAAVRASGPAKVPEGWDLHSTPHGLYVYDPERISPEEINQALPPVETPPEVPAAPAAPATAEPLGNSEALAQTSGNSGELTPAAESATKEVAAPATITGATAGNAGMPEDEASVLGNPGIPAEVGESPIRSAAESLPPPAPPGRRFALAPRKDGVPDILDAIQELGGIRPPGESVGGEYDGYKEAMVGPARLLRNQNARHTPDTIIHELQDLGDGTNFKRIQTPDHLWAAIKAAVNERRAYGERAKAENNTLRADARQQASFDRHANRSGRGKEPLVSDSLNEGDTFELHGAKFTVKELHFDANNEVSHVVLKDGPEFGTRTVPAGFTLHVDKGTVQPAAAGSTDFLPPGESAPTPTSAADEAKAAHDRITALFGNEAVNTKKGTQTVAVPKLRPGEKGTGSLLQGDEPFNLAGEKGIDTDRIAAEKAQAAAKAQAAKDFEAKHQPDMIESWLQRGIDATKPDGKQLLDGVTGAPVWMSQAVVHLTLQAALHTYRFTRDLGKSVADGLAWLRAQQITGYDEQQAREWIQQVLEHTAAGKTEGRLFGAGTNELRPIEATRPDDWSTVNATTTEPLLSDLHSLVTGDGWRQRAQTARAWLGGLAGETFPRTTRAARQVGEQMARWIASRSAAVPLADGLVDDVGRGLDLDDVKFGAALHEDNLRSIQQRLLKQAAGQADPNKVFDLRRQAANVFTFVGDKGVFKDENDYQNFLSHPRTQEAIRRYKDLRARLIEPMYLEAMRLDPSLQLEPRGLQTGARINLNWVNPGELAGPDVYVANPTPRGKLANVLTKRSPFGRIATGNALGYRPSFRDSIRNTYARQLEIANRNKFDRLLVASGNAVVDAPGARPSVQGEATEAFEQRRQTIMLDKDGSMVRIPQNQNIYVRKSLAGEYARALNLDRPAGDQLTIVKALNKFANTAALSGLTDVSAHVSNLSHALFTRPGISQSLWREIGLSAAGRADIGVALYRAMQRFSDTDQQHMRELATIGALREPHPEGSKWNPMRFGAALIQHLDTRTRLQLDRMYGNLRDQGLVQNSETARREFVNQVGQYNKRAQGPMMRWFRDTGLGPFATAGRAFNVLGARTAMLHPGAPATTPAARIALATAMASKIAGTALLIGATNYVLTHNQGGGTLGRPGVRIGTIDLGKDDKNGRPLTLDLANLLGLGRAARVTGIRGALESSRNNLPLGTVLDSAYRDIVNSWVSPFAGPTIRAATIAATGQQPAVRVPPTAPTVPPGQSQALQNIKTAAVELSPISAGIHDSLQPGSTGWEWAQKQLGRFTLQPGKAPSMMANYPRIVDRAQASAYMDDVIRRARNMDSSARRAYVNDAINNLQPADRPHARQQVIYRHVFR